MAKDGHTILVCGLPIDINENRLLDKLFIHFLRKKNGGGDISSVTVPKTTPGCALITFEDSEVAQRVITHGNHTLSVNDKQYAMTVSLQEEEIDPDELFIDITVIVDYNKLPRGKAALSDIRRRFPDIKFNFDPQDNLCILRGRYSEVQTLTESLLSGMNSNNAQDVQFPTSEVTSDQKRHHSGKVESQREPESSGQACGLDHSKYSSSASERSYTLPHASYATPPDYSEVSGVLEKGPSVEDFSMVIDTDIFRYLQHCSVDYQSILDRHRVEVLDVTTKDITTLFLQAGVVGGGMESIKRAYEELSWLYQAKEAQLRKVHLPKEGLHLQELPQAIEVLTQTFPKLLINEDKVNIYLVGSGSSVSEAKQFLIDMEPITEEYSQDKNKPSNVLFQPSGASSLSFMPDTHPRLGGAEGTKTHKLATTFERDVSPDESKDNDVPFSSLGEVKTPKDDQTHPPWSTTPNGDGSQRFDSGPTSEIMSARPKELKVLTKTAEDHLCKKNEPLSTASTKSPPSPSFGLNNPNGTKNAATFSASRSYSLDYTPLSSDKAIPTDSVKHSKSGSILRQANSFSGHVRSRQDRKVSSLDMDPVSSLKLDNSSETKEVFSVEVTVPVAQWVYINEKYLTQIENLTTDLQMKVTGTGKGAEKVVILHLRGADATNVGKTQQGLKELVAKVAEDFSTKELPLVHLGVSHSKKEIVEALCDVVRAQFEKVLISPMANSIFFFGPEVDCQNALHAMKELHIGTEREISTEERPFDLRVPSSTPPLNYGLYPSATDSVFDDKTTIGQTALATNNFLPKASVERMSSDYPQSTKAKQRDRVPEPEYREEDVLKKDYLNRTQNKRDVQPSFKGVGPSYAQEAPVSNLFLTPAECLDRKSFRTRTPGDTSSGVKERECKGSTPLSDIGSQLLTGPQSETGQTLGTHELRSQTDDVDPRSATNQMRASKPDEALRKGNTARSFEESVSKILGQCPWCQGKVNPYCSMCPRSDTLAPQRSSEEDSGANHYGDQPEERGLFCACGTRVESVTACGVTMCPTCKERFHSDCKLCPKSTAMVSGIRGTIAYTEMSFSLPGNSKDTTLKLTYDIPDGIQGIDHPNPGAPFQGGKFHAFLPMNDITCKLLPALEQAFKKGVTFNVKAMDTGDMAVWGRSIPHKTSIEGGLSRNGFPDASYLKRLAAALKSQSVEEN